MKQRIRNAFQKRISFLICCCFLLSNASAQTGGIPHLQVFSGKEVGTDKRVFSVAKDREGLIYLAIPDESRVIVFDGTRWMTYQFLSEHGHFVLTHESRVGSFGRSNWLLFEKRI